MDFDSPLEDFLSSDEEIQGHVADVFILLYGDTDGMFAMLDLTELDRIQEEKEINNIILCTLSSTVYQTYPEVLTLS